MKFLTALILALSVMIFASWALQSSPPAGQAAPSAAGASEQPSVTPQQGQTAEQQKKDLSECYEIAKAKTGIDPSALGLGGKKPPSAGGEAQSTQSGASTAADAAGAAAGAAQQAAGAATSGGDQAATSSTKDAKLNKFQLASQACMQARGYLVKTPAAAPAAEPPK